MSIGEVLQSARSATGTSVEHLSRATKIRGQLIREIESDDFHGCGGAVYARGHIRALAAALDLDPEPLVAEYDRLHGAPRSPGVREVFEREVLDVPSRTSPNWTAAMAVAAAVLLVVALVSLFQTDQPRPGDAAQAIGASPTPSRSAPAPAPESPRAEQPLALAHAGGVSVRVRIVSSRSWVAAVVDGKQVFGRTLPAGAQMDFKGARLVHLTLGNAGAVQLVVNGRDLGTPGGAGKVLRLDFGPGDPAAGSSG